MQVEFGDEIFFFEFIHYLNLTVSRSGASLLRTSNSNFHVATCLGLHRPRRLLSPLAGCESHNLASAACTGNKLNTHPIHPERALSSLAAAGAPRGPMRLVGPACCSRRSPVLVRRRTARVSLNASRQARARRLRTFREISPHARLFACTSGLLCRRLWVCVLVVSC